MKLIAHSAKEQVPEQPYKDHVINGLEKAKRSIIILSGYLSADDQKRLESLVYGAYCVHDLGKLCNYSQMILRHKQKGKMPNHVDAGVAFLLQTKRTDDALKAWIVKSHHWGYDNFPHTRFTGYKELRDSQNLIDRCQWIFDKPNPPANGKMCDYTDSILPYLTQLHNDFNFPEVKSFDLKNPYDETGLFMRMALSILVSADHFDTARNYKNFVVRKKLLLKPDQRLKKLDRYVKKLSAKKPDEIKNKVYEACRNSTQTAKLVCCKSEVGTGKTTALMAYALKKAIELNLRRIIYVAPFTNIISQTVDVYREALSLYKEDKLEVVAEHHHQVDFLADIQEQNKYKKDPDIEESKIVSVKKITTDWYSPIVCTTAVQFFETLAATGTSKLRKLHHLPGSVIIIDEAHSCIPASLWPMTLIWLKALTERYGCVVVLASGSLVAPWKNEQIIDIIGEIEIPSIISDEVSKQTLKRENNRVPIIYDNYIHQDPESFCQNLAKPMYKGSKVVICNTIKNAALIADCLRRKFGEDYVKHISTCLTPKDRIQILDSVVNRLKNEPDRDWVLVATSCIEAGVDISFKYGFRENSSVMSVMQLAGRVSRNNEYAEECKLIVFELFLDMHNRESSIFTFNPDFYDSRLIFKKMVEKYKDKLGPQHCEEAFDEELKIGLKKISARYDPKQKITVEEMIRAEKMLSLKLVDDHYNVITADKRTVIILNDDFTEDDLENFSITEIVRNSVQLYEKQIEKMPVSKSDRFEDFFIWQGNYDNFLGYQAEFFEQFDAQSTPVTARTSQLV